MMQPLAAISMYDALPFSAASPASAQPARAFGDLIESRRIPKGSGFRFNIHAGKEAGMDEQGFVG
jgi:hypothetical protein